MIAFLNKVKNKIFTYGERIGVYCRECYGDRVAFEDVKDMSMRKMRPYSRWAAKRFDSAWFMICGAMKRREGMTSGLYLAFDGDALIYDASGKLVGTLNNRKNRADSLSSTRGNKFFPLDISEGEAFKFYIEVVNNAPKRPRSFPAFFFRAVFAYRRDDVMGLYYDALYRYLTARDKKEVSDIIFGIKDYGKEEIQRARNAFAELNGENNDRKTFLTNNISYGHLRPLGGYSREMTHEMKKALCYVSDGVKYLTSSVYDIVSIKDKALRDDIRRAVLSSQIVVSANLTDLDTSVVSGEFIARGLKLGQNLCERLYGFRSNIATFNGYTLPKNLPDLLCDAGINKLYTKYRYGKFRGIHTEVDILDNELEGMLTGEFSAEMIKRGLAGTPEYEIYSGEIVRDDTQGAYTTMARLKVYNRQIEQSLHDLEFLATCRYLTGHEYPHSEIDELYMTALKYASYNALGGNNIKEVNDALRVGYNVLGERIKAAREKLASDNVSKAKRVVNPSPFARSEWFKIGSNWRKCDVEPYSVKTVGKPVEPDESKLSYTDKSIENDVIRVTFNKNGEIVSLFNKKTNEEHIGGASARIYMYNDPKLKDNAINISDNYYKGIKATLKLRKHKVFKEGAMIVWQNVLRFRRNSILMNVVLLEGSDSVRIDAKVKWEDTNTMLRIEFTPKSDIDKVASDIPFGTMEREPNSKRGGHGEFAANKWVLAGGLGIAADSKYGYRVSDKTISVALLRSTRSPDPTSDIGTHYFTLGVLGGADVNAMTRLGYGLVSPLRICDDIASFEILVSSDKDNVVIETVKKADRDDSIVVRLYENCGKETDVHINTAFSYDHIVASNIMEDELERIENIRVRAGEVKTVIFKNAKLV